MRNAPSVMYPVGRCAFYARMLLLLAGLGLVVWVLWWSGWPDDFGRAGRSSWTAGVGLLLWLSWCGFAWRSWWLAPRGQLHWDATAGSVERPAEKGLWRWQSVAYQTGAPLQRVELMLDLQSRVLLRLRNADGVCSWIWAQRQSSPANWNALRRALMASAR